MTLNCVMIVLRSDSRLDIPRENHVLHKAVIMECFSKYQTNLLFTILSKVLQIQLASAIGR